MTDKLRAAAQAVIGYANRYSSDFDPEFLCLVDMLDIALAEPTWIPVAARRPEHGQAIEVLWRRRATYFETDDREIWGYDPGHETLAWQPLPEPPAERAAMEG